MEIKEAEQLLEDLISADCLRTTSHCRERMGQRRVTVQDVMFAMMKGKVTAVRLNPKTSDYIVTIQSRDIEGVELTMEAALQVRDRRVLCVTVY